VTIWWLAWRSAAARRRLFAWNVSVPVALLAPVAFSAAAAPHRVAVFGVFFVFFATFGSAIPTVRDAGDGWLDTVFQTGVSRSSWLAQTALAATALDLVQLLPVTGLLLASAPDASPVSDLILAGAMTVAFLFANFLGVLLAALVRSLAEAALASAAVSLLLLHFAGFFRTPVTAWTRVAASLDPYTPLRVALARVHAAGAGGPPTLLPTLVALGTVLAIALTARLWTRRFEWPAMR